jgi:hypothetical protein
VFVLPERCEDVVFADVFHGITAEPFLVEFFYSGEEVKQEDLEA